MVDDILNRRLSTTTRLRGYWAHVLLFACGIMLALWEHGDATLTLCLLPAVLVVALLSRLPERLLPPLAAKICQGVIALAAGTWGWYRHHLKVPPDMLLVESLAILGFAFLFTRQQRELRIFLFISLLLCGYGTLLPTRTLPFAVMPLAGAVFLWILYRTSSEESLLQEHRDAENCRPRLHLALRVTLHVIVLVAAWFAVKSVMPEPKAPAAGLAPVSIVSSNPMAPTFGNWVRGRRLVLDPQGEEEVPWSYKPTSQGGANMAENQAENDQGLSVAGGGGNPGRDIVMRVKSPLKLYWLGRVYDVYNGTTWSCSPELRRERVIFARRTFLPEEALVKQEVVIEKWISPTLFSAYMPYGMPLSNSIRVRAQYCMFQAILPPGKSEIGVPFAYTVQSLVPGLLSRPEVAAVCGTWSEKLPRTHYLALPDRKVSARTRELALQLTRPCRSDLEKALALRDYLRAFEYTMDVGRVPDGAEAIDWFLFDRRAGHCEYFAAAMTILARVAGLPARVCTGYAPGNLNRITGYYEVHEYHAHAWSQLFIAGQGWLTLDATPASGQQFQPSLQARLMGSRDNPFAEEWRVQTPEANRDVARLRLDRAEKELQARGEKKKADDLAGSRPPLPGPKPGRSAVAGSKRPARPHAPVPGGDMLPANMENLEDAPAYKVMLFHLRQLGKNLVYKLAALLPYLTLESISAAVMALLIVYLGLHITPYLRLILRQRRQWHQAERWLRRAAETAESHPESSITFAFFAIRDFLFYLGWHEGPAEDLSEYAARIYRQSKTLGRDAEGVFLLYTRRRYSPEPLGSGEAALACDRARAIRQLILDFQHGRNPAGNTRSSPVGNGK